MPKNEVSKKRSARKGVLASVKDQKVAVTGVSHVDESLLFARVAAIIENRKSRAVAHANMETHSSHEIYAVWYNLRNFFVIWRLCHH